MKTIKIMIAASEEMHDEKLEFSNLIEHLNEVLEPRGIELKRVKWNPETDGTLEDFQTKLTDCEMCLTLYWKELAGNSEEELNRAYQQLKDGCNPRKLYVFFKEPTEELSDALKDFKANFITNYGHFFCKFENVDTMNLHFILQLEAYQSHLRNKDDQLVKVTGGKVTVADKDFVNLDKVPFAALNKEYQRLQKELLDLDIQLTETRKRYKEYPDNEDIEDELMAIKSKRKKLADEFEKYQTHLYDIALNFAKTAGEKYSERMRKARELFEIGDVNGADEILNMQEMLTESKNELTLYEQNRHNLEIRIEEFLLKADVVMANKMISYNDRFANANTAFIQALIISRSINIDKNKLADILFSYACFLDNEKHVNEAISAYEDALKMYRDLSIEELTPNIIIDLWFTLHNLSILLMDSRKYSEAEKMLYESLDLYKTFNNSYSDLGIDLSKEAADTLTCLANLHREKAQYENANIEYNDAMKIYERLQETNPIYHSNIADINNNIGNLMDDLGEFEDAKIRYNSALVVYQELAKSNPNIYLPYIAMVNKNIAITDGHLGYYAKADLGLGESLKVYRLLAKDDPVTYMPEVGSILYSLGSMQLKLENYEKAEQFFTESLAIRKIISESNYFYIPGVASTHYALGYMQIDMGKYEDAEDNLYKALEIRQQLAKENPDGYNGDVAASLEGIAFLEYSQGFYEEAEHTMYRALVIYEELEEKMPGKYTNKINRIKEFFSVEE